MSSTPSILCAVDLSSHSRTVLQHAGAIADHFGARLITATITPSNLEPEREADTEPPRAEAALRAFVLDVLPAAASWTGQYEVRVGAGAASSTILQMARDEGVDLIVVGTYGVSGFRKHMFGSTTEGVLRHADFPVLVVPQGASHLHSLDDRREVSDIGSVLAPIDFSPLSRRDARVAAGIAAALNVPLLLVHVIAPAGVAGVLDRVRASGLDPDVAAEQLLALRAELRGETPIETMLLQGHPAEEIASLAERRNVGLVVMGLRGAGGTLGPRPGSIAYRTLCLTPAMVLALPPVLRKIASRPVVTERHTV